jgi:hypothetical protein
MNTKRIIVAATMGLFVAAPAVAATHAPGVADPPQVTNQTAQLPSEAPSAPQAAATRGSSQPAPFAADQRGEHHLGYVMKGDRAFRHNVGDGNPW